MSDRELNLTDIMVDVISDYTQNQDKIRVSTSYLINQIARDYSISKIDAHYIVKLIKLDFRYITTD